MTCPKYYDFPNSALETAHIQFSDLHPTLCKSINDDMRNIWDTFIILPIFPPSSHLTVVFSFFSRPFVVNTTFPTDWKYVEKYVK